MPKREGWLNASEAAKFLQVSRASFYRMLEDGRLRGVGTYSPGERLTLYKHDDLQRWMEGRLGKVAGSE